MATEAHAARATTLFGLYVEKGAGRTVSTQRYDESALDYDKHAEVTGYTGPNKMATTMATLFQGTKDNIRVLDVAAGTGLSGVELYRAGFRQIDAVDPSQGMLDVARARSVYGRLICDYVDDKHQLDVPDNYYDAVTICGGMGNNHLPPGAFDEIIRVVKPGGFVVNVTRIHVFTGMDDYIDILGPHFRALEASGKWEEESRTSFRNYLDGVDGMAIVHRICA